LPAVPIMGRVRRSQLTIPSVLVGRSKFKIVMKQLFD
jgi:hypothetical protein